jgi:hypothetical protein
MLEVNEFDKSRPEDARTPEKTVAQQPIPVPSGMLSELLPPSLAAGTNYTMVPIETPLSFAGFHENVLHDLSNVFQQMGVTVGAGGVASTSLSAKPAPGWQNSLQPGDAVSGVLVTGDMSVSGMCTVTYNDGKHILACGHSFFNLGPVDMPMAKADVLMTLASAFQPNKMGNATDIVGALHQDRHSAGCEPPPAILSSG